MADSPEITASTASVQTGPRYRSGAVARLAQMPVATLRIWEQRYQAVRPATAPSGHRLYSPADVQRVLLLRQLTRQGHAIGALAGLDATRLQQVADTAMGASAAAQSPEAVRAPGVPSRLRIAVVGSAMAARLQRPSVQGRLAAGAVRISAFGALEELTGAGARVAADWLIWQAPELHPQLPDVLRAARQACGARLVSVVYRFGSAADIRAVVQGGASALREPTDDGALGDWMAATVRELTTRPPLRETAPATAPVGSGALAPRRFDDAALTAIAGLSPTLACECPRHVAELLMQLSSFEAYSAGCAHRNPADAQLHAYLQQVAGASRALFETALEHLARHEGLPLR